MTNKRELAAKLYNKTEGSRKLDLTTFLEVHETHYWKPNDINRRQLHFGPPKDRCVDSFICWEDQCSDASEILRYTTSLDDAMTLPGAEDLLQEALHNVQRIGWYKGGLAKALALELVRLYAASEGA